MAVITDHLCYPPFGRGNPVRKEDFWLFVVIWYNRKERIVSQNKNIFNFLIQ